MSNSSEIKHRFMKQLEKYEKDPRLVSLRKEVEIWRSSKSHMKEKTPEILMRKAAYLCETIPIGYVARVSRLNFYGVRSLRDKIYGINRKKTRAKAVTMRRNISPVGTVMPVAAKEPDGYEILMQPPTPVSPAAVTPLASVKFGGTTVEIHDRDVLGQLFTQLSKIKA